MSATVIFDCPFCAYDDVEIGEIEPGRFAVDCPDCECIGPFGDTMDEAIAKWNAAARPGKRATGAAARRRAPREI